MRKQGFTFTCIFLFLLDTKVKVKKYVILSASEISHRKSTELILRRPPPSREFAAVATLLRNDNKKVCHIKRTWLEGIAATAAIPSNNLQNISLRINGFKLFRFL